MKTTFFALLLASANLAAQADSFFQQPVPSLSMTAPDALGRGYFGHIGLGGNTQNTTRLNDDRWGPDANAIITIGLGNPEKYIGVDLRVNIYGTSNTEGEQQNLGEGSVDWHISRRVARRFWLATGGYDLLGWDRSRLNQLESFYLCATTFLPLRRDNSRPFSTIFLNAGFGNGRFRSDKNFTTDKTSPAGVFADLAIQVLPRANLLVEWSGYGPFVGTSFIPFRKIPVQVVFGADDLLHGQWRWVLAGSVGFRFGKKKGGAGLRDRFLPVVPPPQSSRV